MKHSIVYCSYNTLYWILITFENVLLPKEVSLYNTYNTMVYYIHVTLLYLSSYFLQISVHIMIHYTRICKIIIVYNHEYKQYENDKDNKGKP